MITKRDQNIINLITEEKFRIVTTNQIHRLFFTITSYRYTTKRLEYLFNQGYIKRTKSTIDNCFAYYIDKKPVQLHHDLIRTEIYSHIKTKLNLLEWHNEYTVDNIRPDAFCFINDNGIPFPVFVEVHLSNKFNFDKYLHLMKTNDLKMAYGFMPRVLIVTDRQVTIPKGMTIKFKIIDLNMSNLDSLFK